MVPKLSRRKEVDFQRVAARNEHESILVPPVGIIGHDAQPILQFLILMVVGRVTRQQQHVIEL